MDLGFSFRFDCRR